MDASVRQLAKSTQQEVTIDKRILEMVDVLEGGTQLAYGFFQSDGYDLSYGRGGTNVQSGTLYSLIQRYCAAPQALQANELQNYLYRLQQKDSALASDPAFQTALQKASSDPIMRQLQDDLFKKIIWTPAVQKIHELGLKLPLSFAIVYDTIIGHGMSEASSVARKTSATVGGMPISGTDEKLWIATYLGGRLELYCAMVAQNPKLYPFLRGWTRRVEAWQNFLAGNNWDLAPPVQFAGQTIE